MRIALINENSQAAKNALILTALKNVVAPMGHSVDNYSMYTATDAAQLTYVQVDILVAILLNSGAADYVITGEKFQELFFANCKDEKIAAYIRSLL